MRFIFSTLVFMMLPVWLAAQQQFYIKFPDDKVLTNETVPVFPLLTVYEYADLEVYNPDSLPIIVSHTDWPYEMFPGHNFDFCYAIERTWYISMPNPDSMSTNHVFVPNPSPHPLVYHPTNLSGPIVSPLGTPSPWAPTVVKLNPTSPNPTNYSIYWDSTATSYSYTLSIIFYDFEAPVLNDCPTHLNFQDTTTNDPYLWNGPLWFNEYTGTYDLEEMPVELSVAAWDSMSGITYNPILFLDINADGNYDATIKLFQPQPSGQVRIGGTIWLEDGTLTSFDNRTVPESEKYRFTQKYNTWSGFPSYTQVAWKDDSTWVLPQLPPGNHKIRCWVEDGCGNGNTCEYSFTIQSNTPQTTQQIFASIYRDSVQNCQPAISAPKLTQGWRTRLEYLNSDGQPYAELVRPANEAGLFGFRPDTGNYRVTVIPPNDYWSVCVPDTTFAIEQTGDTTAIGFGAQALVDCPLLETHIGAWGLRRCFDNVFTVEYCNTGTASAPNAYLDVRLDPYLSFISAELPALPIGNNTYRFDVGDIAVGECGRFKLTANLDCDSTIIGQTHCVESHIYPDSICIPTGGWNGANVELDGECQDSVRFVLYNTGNASTSLLEYIVIEDNIINSVGNFQLLPGDSIAIAFPANGSTWTLVAEQQPGNPAGPQVSTTVEGCGGPDVLSIGFSSQFGEEDGNPFTSQLCLPSVGSYDPNDKLAEPKGYGPQHFIAPGQPLLYRIRFQNTGTDTAFKVVVLDTLPPQLDPATISGMLASHNYRMQVLPGNVLDIRFENILLPDSNINEAASHGFVQFLIKQRENLPLGTEIHNRAAIYFDYNLPVITPDVWHTLGENYVLSNTGGPLNTASPTCLLWPNPVAGSAVLHCARNLTGTRLVCYNALGQLVHTFTPALDGSVDFSSLNKGQFFYAVERNGMVIGRGRFLKQ